MKQYDKETLSQIKAAVYQERPYIVITLDNDFQLSLSGKENEIDKALKSAMNHDPRFKRLVRNAIVGARPRTTINSNTITS